MSIAVVVMACFATIELSAVIAQRNDVPLVPSKSQPKKQSPVEANPVNDTKREPPAPDVRPNDDSTPPKPPTPNGRTEPNRPQPGGEANRPGKRTTKPRRAPAAEPGVRPKPKRTLPPRDQIDSLAPQDPRVAKVYRTTLSKLEARDWDAAMELLQRLLEPRRQLDGSRRLVDSLVRSPEGRWVSIHNEANRLLHELPPELMDQYRRLNEPAARVLLGEAEMDGDLDKFVEVATRYFHTDAGRVAANVLGTHHFDRGEFGLAARWFAQLFDVGAPIAADPKWRLKAAFAFQKAGLDEKAEEILATLSTGDGIGELTLGNERISPSRWLERMRISAPGKSPLLDEWRTLYGSASRTGAVDGGTPLLLERWSVPRTTSSIVRNLGAELVHRLRDLNRAVIPTAVPLAVGDRIVFRTLAGVQVVDAIDGARLWETETDVPPEKILLDSLAGTSRSSVPVPRFGRQFGINGRGAAYRQGNPDHHQLTSLLCRDGTSGVLSSDGERLFVIEDHAIMPMQIYRYRWGQDLESADPYNRSWSTNKIAAYDLDSGRRLWSVGGVEMQESFDLPLAGTYFFGAPVADGRELFAIGEKHNEIRLHALDAETGKLLWSELIAHSDAKISQDLGRRNWIAQVSVGDGILVCPTTVGWLVGVDRLRRTVLWATRYSPANKRKQNRHGGTSLVRQKDLNQTWCPSAPIIRGNRVIYTPSEEHALCCFDLLDGSLIWKDACKGGLYLAGVFDDRIVVVATNRIVAYALDHERSEVDRQEFGDDLGTPSGLGVATSDSYYLPFSSGKLLQFALADLSIVNSQQIGDGRDPLGNLTMYLGKFFSLSPFEMRGFEQLEPIADQIRERYADSDDDAWALLHEAEIHMIRGESTEALPLLRRIQSDLLDQPLRERYRQQLIASLSATIREGNSDRERSLDELAAIVETKSETIRYQSLRAEHEIAEGRFEQAFDIYHDLFDTVESLQIRSEESSQISIELTSWLAGKFQDLWDSTPDTDRAMLDNRVEQAASASLTGNTSARWRFLSVFGFHDAAIPVRQALAEQHQTDGEFALAEQLLSHLAQHSKADVAADALVRLVRLLAQAGRPSDAAYFARMLEQQFANIAISAEPGRPSSTGAEFARLWLETSQAATGSHTPPTLDWSEKQLTISRLGSTPNSERQQEISTSGNPLPFFQQHRLLINSGRLTIVNATDESVYWSLPIKSGSSSNRIGGVISHLSGHCLYVWTGKTVHCLSLIDRRVLWSQSIDSPSQPIGGGSSGYRIQTYQLKPLNQSKNYLQLSRRGARRSSFPVANAEYVCIRGRRGLTVIDAKSGETRWSLEHLAANTEIYGTESALFVVNRSSSRYQVLRAADGKQMQLPPHSPPISKVIVEAIHVTGNLFVEFVTERSGARKSATRGEAAIRAYEPTTGKEHWRFKLPTDARLAQIEDPTLVIVDKGQITLLDLNSGRTKRFADRLTLPKNPGRADSYVVADHQRIYCVLNENSKRRVRNRGNVNLAQLPVHGTISVFDRRSGRQLWSTDRVGVNGMVLQSLRQMPALLFMSRTTQQFERRQRLTLNLLVLDKKTGREIAVASIMTNNVDFQSLAFHPRDQYLELRSFSERLQLRADDRLADSSAVSAPKPVKTLAPD